MNQGRIAIPSPSGRSPRICRLTINGYGAATNISAPLEVAIALTQPDLDGQKDRMQAQTPHAPSMTDKAPNVSNVSYIEILILYNTLTIT